jgi:hypothetical protein
LPTWRGACDDAQEAARLGKPLRQHGGLGASEHWLAFTHFIEYFCSMK